MTISDQLFNKQNQTASIDSSTSISTEKCCHGVDTFPILINGISNPNQVETFKQDILNLLIPNADTNDKNGKNEPASWILLRGPLCLEPELLDVFIQAKDENTSLISFTFTMLCLLVNEERFFENWVSNNESESIEQYQTNTVAEYEKRIHKFFEFLNSSEYLQKNTLLVEGNNELTDDNLQDILKDIFRKQGSKHRATNIRLRSDMVKLFQPRNRTEKSIKTVRRKLRGEYRQNAENVLRSLLNDLKNSSTAENAARRVIAMVLDEFYLMSKEEKRYYRRQLILGYGNTDLQNSNTIAAQLVHYALRLLENYQETTISFIYSIVLVIRKLGSHFVFCHELFYYIPEIYKLSLVLVTQRHYALTIGGIRLCTTILKADENENKYALAFLTNDPLTARKVLDAIKWLLSPYATLKTLWEQELVEQKSDFELKKNSPLYHLQIQCFEHTNILLEQSYMRYLALLFHSSADHCRQVTNDDLHKIVETIDVLADIRMSYKFNNENKSRLCVMLISDLCTFLTPILLYSPALINTALLKEDRLLSTIPRAILTSLTGGAFEEEKINRCIRFYTKFVQLKCKQLDRDNDTINNEDYQISTVTVPELVTTSTTLSLSKDLISSYYNLYRQFQQSVALDEKLTQQQQLEELFKTEWKKIDVLQLKHDYDQFKQEYQLVTEELMQLTSELDRMRHDRDQLKKETMQMVQEIKRLESKASTNLPHSSKAISTETSPKKNTNKHDNIIDQLQNLSPHEITPEQAEQCIREIYRRRTTFDDQDMRKSICGSLKHLGSDLYSSSVHFLHELIQNAEDNFYDDTIVPCLRVELNHDYILLSNNEQGLRARDVLAICSLAVTTKTTEKKHIGEKGVGFKSVFAASNQPMLISHAWKFRFKVPGIDAMSYIIPLWVDDENIPECVSNQVSSNTQSTHLYLPLKLKTHTPVAEQFLNDVVAAAVDPCILLNMRQLKKLEIVDRRQESIISIDKEVTGTTSLNPQDDVSFEKYTFRQLTGSIIALHTSTGNKNFRVYTCEIDVPSSIEQRRDPTTSLMIAFPCETDCYLNANVYTGLPVCYLGFNFMFNADFHLVTSRESVRENVFFNVYLRDHLAVLFAYLILNDTDLRKDFSRYYPSSNAHQIKHSSWWRLMLDLIKTLITNNHSVLLGIGTGELTRQVNTELVSLISTEQLYNCANIRVIDTSDGSLTTELLQSFQIQPVSIQDVLQCFPDQEDMMNKFRQEFHQWTQKQDERWWSQFFHHLSKAMTPKISTMMLQKPIFILQNSYQRQYLPRMNDTIPLRLFVNDDVSMRMWKRQITLLRYTSQIEKNALLNSDQVQSLTEGKLIDIILTDHLELACSSIMSRVNAELIEELWQDLFYLRSHLNKFDKSAPLVVPINEISSFALIRNAVLPTIFGVNIQSFMQPITSPIIHHPYYGTDENRLINNLQWEYFFLELNCQRPSIYLSENYSINKLPCLSSFTMLTDERWAKLCELIFEFQIPMTQESLRQFPIITQVNNEPQFFPVSATFDETMVSDLSFLPRVTIPPYCRSFASKLDVCTEYDLHTCVTILQLLSNKDKKDTDLYIQWLGRLQLNVRQQLDTVDPISLLSSCQLYLPDSNQFYSLDDLLVISDNDQHRQAISLVCKYCKLQMISPTNNQPYWQFRDLFHRLGCRDKVTISDIYSTICIASHDKSNFFDLGDGETILTNDGVETIIILFQYFESLIEECVTKNAANSDLYTLIITDKRRIAPCGSLENFEWRFSFTRNKFSEQLKLVIKIHEQHETMSILTNDKQMVSTNADHIIYACFETKIIQNLSKHSGKRYFISPTITETCPLVLAALEIDYVERRGKVQWIHKHNNEEFYLDHLTQIFKNTLDDQEIKVVTSRFASIDLYLSDIGFIDDVCEKGVDKYIMESDYPFWAFDKIVLLCSGDSRDDASKAIIATSALATLLHKRKYIPFEEAKLIARQKVSECKAFRSDVTVTMFNTNFKLYSYLKLIFPKDHRSIENLTIYIRGCFVEKDSEEDTSATTNTIEDRIFQSRAETQNHCCLDRKPSDNWMDPTIVDSQEQIRIGQNAERFFFAYLQKLYGTHDVTPIQNWRSSSRLAFYRQSTRNVDDSVGYDFELHDTQEKFARGTKAKTKICYFEVKGTSGSFDATKTMFNISQNEFETCQIIANDPRRQEQEAYFIIIIEDCLDLSKIGFGTIINWSDDLRAIKKVIHSYQCRFSSSQAVPTDNNNYETIETVTDDYQQNARRQQFAQINDRSARSNYNKSTSQSNQQRQYQHQQSYRQELQQCPPQQQQTYGQQQHQQLHGQQQQQNKQYPRRSRGWNQNSTRRDW